MWHLFKGLILPAIECCMCLEIQQYKVFMVYFSFSNLENTTVSESSLTLEYLNVH